jgi:hypothetical protein
MITSGQRIAQRPNPAALASGLYVVQFPDRVKIGRSIAGMASRIADHVRDGATRVVAFCVPLDVRVDIAERDALAILQRCAEQIGRSESFLGVTFEEAENIVACVLRRHSGDWPEVVISR